MKSYYQYAEDVVNGKIVTGEIMKLACLRFKDDLKRKELEFREEVADYAISFIGVMKHFKGKSSGMNFILEPWQAFIVANIVGWYWKDSGDRRFTSSYIEVSRKNGKALALDTPIPTPNGWSTMGELKVGDYVLGQDGLPTKVTFTTEIKYNHNCYSVKFEDGETIIADAEHNWYIRDKKNVCSVKTTQELLNFKREGRRGTEYLYRVPMNKPIELPEAELPLDPYVLGCWLGDGTASKPNFTVSKEDLEMYDPFIELFGQYKLREDCNTLDVSFAGEKGKNNSILRHQLIEAGVFKNKHIPSIYLRASKEQRLALLLGLMDTDGTISKDGLCEFVLKNKLIADGLCELLSSLGIKYHRTIKIPTCNGKKCDEVERINFFTDKKLPCFRLKRKYDRLKDALNKRMNWKSIIDITPVESVPVKCITVDNEDHLYLCGNRFTTTHNTALAAALCLYYLIADGEDGAEVDLAANSKELARIAFEFCNGFTKGIDPRHRYLKANKDQINLDKTNSTLRVFAADDSKLDGFNASFGLLDEYHAAKNSKVRDVIKSSMGMRRNPHLCTITTAGFDKSLPCYRLRLTAIEILHNLKEDDSFFIAIYALDENDDWTKEENWVKCTPNLDITVTSKYLKELVKSAINNPSEEVGVKTKNLNIWCDTASVWLSDNYIVKASLNVNLADFKDEICYIGVDLSATSDLTAVSYLIPKDDKYYFKVDYYLPESCLFDNLNKELYKLWKSQGLLNITQGNVTDYDYITKDLLKWLDHLQIQTVGYDKWNATQFAINSLAEGLPMEEYSQSIGNFNQPTKEFERLILSGRVVLDNNEITRWCFGNVTLKEDHNGNCKPIKKVKMKKIDGVIATLQALGVYLLNPNYGNDIFIL